jgi:hypothetical protein
VIQKTIHNLEIAHTEAMDVLTDLLRQTVRDLVNSVTYPEIWRYPYGDLQILGYVTLFKHRR